MSGDEWRVEVDLEDAEHGYPIDEKVRSLHLDDDARKRLGRGVIVTRDGPRFFLYAATEDGAAAAESVVRGLLESEGLTATIAVTRWHPIEEVWKDAALPLPRTPEEEEAERARHEAAEEREARIEGEYDWRVKVALHHRRDAIALEERLHDEELPVRRRFHYLTVDAPTEERATEIGAMIQELAPEGTQIWVEPNPDDLPHTLLDTFPSLF
ncbi:MAG: hypothetical protein U0R69_11870 [Gaiellales bacterium]